MKKTVYITALFVLTAGAAAKAQQGFGTSTPAPSTVIDMTAANKGALLPRVVLTSTAVAAPVTSPANALTVFNTNTAGDVTPGYYYWSTLSSKWIRLLSATDAWSLKGNAGTTAGTDFMGTTDDIDVIFKRNNQQSGLLNISRSTTAWGVGALILTAATNSSAFGASALAQSTADGNNAFGASALGRTTTGVSNNAFGRGALGNNIAGQSNSAFGDVALGLNTGSANTALGYGSLPNNTTGQFNTAVGNAAGGNNITNSNNTFIGYNTKVIGIAADPTPTNATAIGANAVVATSNSMVLGGTGASAVNVGIGTTAPTSTLQTNGSVAAAIKVVSSNYTLTDKDYTLILSGVAAVNTITVTFPQASTCPGRIYVVVNYTSPAANTSAVNPQIFSSFDGVTAELKALSGTANPAATVTTTGSSAGPSAGIQVTNMRTVWQSDGTTWWLISL